MDDDDLMGVLETQVQTSAKTAMTFLKALLVRMNDSEADITTALLVAERAVETANKDLNSLITARAQAQFHMRMIKQNLKNR